MIKHNHYWFLFFLFAFIIFSLKISGLESDHAISGSKIFYTLGFIGCSESKNGTGTDPEEPELVIAPQELYFGRIPEGHVAARQYKLTNIGNVSLNISSFAIEGNNAGLFLLTGNPSTLQLAPFNSVVFGVEFSPGVSGDFSAQIRFTSNNPSSPDVIPLTGKGTVVAGDAVTFERIIGGLDSDGNSSVAIAADGGYILAGSGLDSLEDEGVAELTKLNKFGDVVWRKQFPGEGTSGFADLVIDNDGSILAVGQTAPSPGRNSNVLVVKTDANGELIWQNIWGGSEKDEAHDVIKTNDGAYLLAGESNNTEASGGVKDALLLKIDAGGNVLWNKLYGTTEGEDARSVAQTADGGYVFTGIKSVGLGQNIFFVKTDADGNQVWQKTYSGGKAGNSVAATDDGGFILAGFKITEGISGQDIYIVKTNSDGDTLWTRTYGGINGEQASEVIETEDLGYLIVGSTESFGAGGNDVYMIKLDEAGNESWVRFYGGLFGDGASSVKETSGYGFIVSGTTGSYGGGSNIYVLKLNADGTF
jgi:hypothetical protein